jgi:hypothetical protein
MGDFMSGRIAGIVASLALLALCAPALAAEDHSLTTQDYMSRGMPAPDRPWSSEDYATAARVLGTLTPDQLPRHGSDRSGDYMARLVDPRNIESCTGTTLPDSTRIGMCVGYIQQILAVAKLYLVAMQRDHAYDDDTLDLTCITLDVTPPMVEMTDAMVAQLDKNDPTYDKRVAGIKQMKDGFAQMLEGSILSLTQERALYSDAARVRLARTLTDVYLRVGSHLEPLTHTEIAQKLSKLARDDPSPEIRAALAPVATAP